MKKLETSTYINEFTDYPYGFEFRAQQRSTQTVLQSSNLVSSGRKTTITMELQLENCTDMLGQDDMKSR